MASIFNALKWFVVLTPAPFSTFSLFFLLRNSFIKPLFLLISPLSFLFYTCFSQRKSCLIFSTLCCINVENILVVLLQLILDVYSFVLRVFHLKVKDKQTKEKIASCVLLSYFCILDSSDVSWMFLLHSLYIIDTFLAIICIRTPPSGFTLRW